MKAKTAMAFRPRQADRYPRLDTILMVEKALYKHRSGKTVTEIWKNLPKQVMWNTFLLILDYLEYSGKIHVEPADRTITWLWNPAKVAELKQKNLVIA